MLAITRLNACKNSTKFNNACIAGCSSTQTLLLTLTFCIGSSCQRTALQKSWQEVIAEKINFYVKPISQQSLFLGKSQVCGAHLTTQTLRACAFARCSLILSATKQASQISVMVNDCSGKVGHAVATAVVEAGLNLIPLSLTGPGRGGRHVNVGNVEVNMHDIFEKDAVLDRVLSQHPDFVVVDYTLPDAVNGNVEFYCERGLPFVMGTTGGDRDKLVQVVQKSGNYAVVAPQMGKQVVAFQAALEIMAEQFPGAFAGYTLHVTESHQSSKVDTSGTAKAVVSTFRKLGIVFDNNEIEMLRDPNEQVTRMAVPKEFLNGHAFHTYQLKSPDGTVSFQFQHNVCGRSIYAQGTVDAVLFLAAKVAEKAEKRLYNMIDVLGAGNMR